jgi:methylthioribose-1-phosphate isomerase
VTVQAITWAPSGAVRVVDQRALPETLVQRDLETIEATAEAIRSLQVRGAPLIGIAAAMGMVAGLRDARSLPRAAFLDRVTDAVGRFAA